MSLYGTDPMEIRYGERVLHFTPLTHEYHLDSMPLLSVTQYLKAAGYIHAWHGNGEAATFGRYVHEATAYDDLGDLDSEQLDPLIAARLSAWRQFREAEGFEPDMTRSERPCFHPIYLYGGIPDRLGIRRGKPCVVEIKTGTKERWHEVQAAGGYTPMLAQHYPEYQGADTLIVYLHEDGQYLPGRDLVVPTDKKLPALFLSITATVNGRSIYGDTNGRA